MGFDPDHARLYDPDWFPRFRVPEEGEALADAGLRSDTRLIVVERAGERRAFLLDELAFHHVAQGELAGEPYVVAF